MRERDGGGGGNVSGHGVRDKDEGGGGARNKYVENIPSRKEKKEGEEKKKFMMKRRGGGKGRKGGGGGGGGGSNVSGHGVRDKDEWRWRARNQYVVNIASRNEKKAVKLG